ncbi:MAG: nucleotidyltransferase domain-containing protein [Candidatus Bathyarchaeota archaeon]|nr:nucleotidyltransferase domain-containing protein [Candidatus Bathyarchaeota archaeon]
MEEKTANSFRILALYRTDYAASLHARAMAKLLNTSHMTLLPHLKKLEQHKILQSKKEGRNKQYTLNKDNTLTKHHLIITEELTTITYLQKNFLIKKLNQHLTNTDTTNPLILFGSYAKGYATEESDIDLFIIGKTTPNQLSQIKKFETTFGKKINIKTATADNFNAGLRTGDILIKEIVRNHIILQNADPFVTTLWRFHTER